MVPWYKKHLSLKFIQFLITSKNSFSWNSFLLNFNIKQLTYTWKTIMNTAAFGIAPQKYSAVLTVVYFTRYFWYNWSVIYSQNKMVCDSFSITGMGHDQWYQLHWYFFSFLTRVMRNFSACLSKFGVFIRNWPACFEKVSFLFASSYCTW